MIDEARLRIIIAEALAVPLEDVRTAVREELHDWGQRVGLDTSDLMAQQADFRHLRRWRLIVEGGGMKAVTTAVFVVVTGLLGLIWVSISAALHK